MGDKDSRSFLQEAADEVSEDVFPDLGVDRRQWIVENDQI